MPSVNMCADGPGQWQQVPKKSKAKKEEPNKKGATTTLTKGLTGIADPAKSAFAALDALSKRDPDAVPENRAGPLSDAEEEEEEVGVKPSDGEEKKIKKPKVKKTKITISQAAEALTDDTVTTFLHGLEESFPEDFEVQLARCADLFDKTFKACELPFNKILQENPMAKSVEQPTCELPQGVIDKTRKWLSNRSSNASAQLARMLLHEVLKGAATTSGKKQQPPKANVGLLMMLALVLRAHPECLLAQAASVRSGPKNNSGEQFRILLWAYGQTTKGALSTGVTLWVRDLLPIVLSTNPSSPRHELGLQFIENILPAPSKAKAGLLKRASKVGGENSVVPIPALLSILKAAYASEDNNALRLRKLYPFIRELALAPGGRSGRTASLLIAPSAELAASTGSDTALHSALLDNFLWSLSADPETTLPLLRDLLLKFPKASPALFTTLTATWGTPEVADLLPYSSQLLNLVQASRAANRGALQAGGLSSAELASLRATESACRALEKKMKPGISFALVAVVLATVLSTLAAGSVALSQHSVVDISKMFSAMLPPDVSHKVATVLIEGSQSCTESVVKFRTLVTKAIASLKA